MTNRIILLGAVVIALIGIVIYVIKSVSDK